MPMFKQKRRTRSRNNRLRLFERLENRNLLTAEISGSIWHDLDGTRIWNPDDPPVANVIVYADTNHNGRFDEGEPFGETTGDGEYKIDDVPSGAYAIAQYLPVAWRQTYPEGGVGYVVDVQADQSITGLDFGNLLSPFFHTDETQIVADATGQSTVFRGINLPGLEYGTFYDRPYPGILGTNYFMPTPDDFDVLQERGFNLARIPFEWARLVPNWDPADPLPSDLNADYLNLLRDVVAMADQRGLYVILDMHDFLKYWDGQNSQLYVNESPPHQQMLAQTWRLLARHFATNPTVLGYDIMNEPVRWADEAETIPGSSNWHAISAEVVQAIRDEDRDHLIFVEAPNYSLASRWPVENPLPWITDVVQPPRVVYSPHVYFDYTESSLYQTPGEADGPIALWEYYVRDRIMPVVGWSFEHEVPLFFGEVGAPSTPAWAEVLGYAFETFFEPLQLSVALWHYIDPLYNQDLLNLALPSGSILLDLLENYPGGTSTPTAPFRFVPADSPIYADVRVNPWHHDGSWGDVVTDASATAHVMEGEHSLSVVFGGNGGGLKFNHQYGLDTSPFDTLVFSIYPTSADLDFTIFSTAPKPPGAAPGEQETEYPQSGAERPSLMSVHGPLIANQWQQVEIPLALFVNPAQPVVMGFAFQDDMQPDAVFYLDGISLVLGNQAPTDIGLSQVTVVENTDGAVVGTVTVHDPNAADTHTLTVSDPRFEIVDSVLKLKDGYRLDHTTEPAVAFDITAVDRGGLSLTKTFVISVRYVNEPLAQRLDWLDQTYAAAPDVAASEAADRIAVVWEGVDGGNQTVFMQLFTAEGAAITAPFMVPQLPGTFRNPAVAIGDDGYSYVAFAGGDGKVYAQRVGPDGGLTGETICLDQHGRYRGSLFVSIGTGGQAAFCWRATELDGSGQDAVFAFVDPALSTVHAYRTGQGSDEAGPHVAVLSDGRSVGVWDHYQGQWSTRVAIFSAAGSADTLWRPFDNTSFGIPTAVWVDEDDNFLLYGSAQAGSAGGAQWYDSQGTPFGDLLIISRPTAMSVSGRFVTGSSVFDRDGDIQGSVPSAAGYAFLGERLVATDSPVPQETIRANVYSMELIEEREFFPQPASDEVPRAWPSHLAAAVGPEGVTAVAWRSRHPETGQDRVALRTTDAAGEVAIETLLDFDAANGIDLVFMDATSLGMLVFHSYSAVDFLTVGLDGNPLGEPIRLQNSSWSPPSIDFVPGVGGLAVTRASGDLQVWSLAAEGTLISSTPAVVAGVSGAFDVAMAFDGSYVLLWQGDAGTDTTGVYGQSFGADHAPLGPAVLLFPSTSVQELDLVTLENGDFVALVRISGQVRAVRLGPDASPRGEPLPIDQGRSLTNFSAVPLAGGDLGIAARDVATGWLVAGTMQEDDSLVGFSTLYKPPTGQDVSVIAAGSMAGTGKIAWSQQIGTTGRGPVLGIVDRPENIFPGVNRPPSVTLRHTVTTLPEDLETSPRWQVAEIVILDDMLGDNLLGLSGPDAAMFEIDGSVLYLSSGVVLDHQIQPQLDVTVEVDDPSVGTTPDAVASLTIAILDIQPPVLTVDPLVINDATPLITGTLSDGMLTVTVAGIVYHPGDGSLTESGLLWALRIPERNALAEGVYDVVASATDAAGKVGVDPTDGELTIDLTPPQAAFDKVLPDPRETHAGTVALQFSEDVLGVSRGAVSLTRDGTAVDLSETTFSPASARTYMLDLSAVTALPGAYRLSLSAAGSGIRDIAGNTLQDDAWEEWTNAAAYSFVEVRLVPVSHPSPVGTTELPPAIARIPVEATYFVELWVQSAAVLATGVQGGSVDVAYSPAALVNATAIVHEDFSLPEFVSGTIRNDLGLIEDLGGATLSMTAGMEPAWARLAYVELLAEEPGDVAYSLAEGQHRFALSGIGNVAWELVDLTGGAEVQHVTGSQVDVRIVRTPTATSESGEVAELPAHVPWLDEWEPYWAEIYVSTPYTDSLGVLSVEASLSYTTEHATAKAFEFQPLFVSAEVPVIDDSAGRITGIRGTTERTDLGADHPVLLGRVRFEPTAVDHAVVDLVNRRIGPYELAVAIDVAEVRLLSGSTASPAESGPTAQVEIWAVPYDMDENDTIDFGDFALFVPQFGKTVDAEEALAWWADFDKSGLVDFGDFSFFAANIFRGKPHDQIVYPADFPQPWRSIGSEGEGVFAAKTDSEPRIVLELVAVAEPAAGDGRDSLPLSLDRVALDSTWYAELWMQQTEGAGGISGGTVDVHASPPGRAVITGLTHTETYRYLTSGSIIGGAQVDDFGGGTFRAGAGVQPAWVRLGWMELSASEVGTVALSINPGALQFSLMGPGNVPWNEISLGTLALEITEPSTWQNPVFAYDVNGDGDVTPLDVLILINDLNVHGARDLPAWSQVGNGPPPYLDPSGDQKLTPWDVLLVINYINAQTTASAIEAESLRFAVDPQSMNATNACVPLAVPPATSLTHCTATTLPMPFVSSTKPEQPAPSDRESCLGPFVEEADWSPFEDLLDLLALHIT
jgi:hypothetical protein